MKRIDNPDQALLENKDVREDPKLATYEKELRIVGVKDQERLTISSEIASVINYVIDRPESEVNWIRTIDSDIVAIHATIPRGLLLLKSKPRESNFWSQVTNNRGDSG